MPGGSKCPPNAFYRMPKSVVQQSGNAQSRRDFAKLLELFDQHQVSFVSVTQSFNTTTSMGRLTLNVLLSCHENSSEELASYGPPPSFSSIMARRRRWLAA